MISGFTINDNLRVEKNLSLEIKPMVVDFNHRNLYGIKEVQKVTIHRVDINFSFKTYRKFFIGPQVCEPTYSVNVILSAPGSAWVESLEDFVRNLQDKKEFDKALQEAFSKLSNEVG